VNGILLKQDGKDYTSAHISLDEKNIPNDQDVNKIVSKFNNMVNNTNNKNNECLMNINLHHKLELISKPISMQAFNNKSKITTKIKVGPISLSPSPAISEYPVIEKLVAKEKFDLQNISYSLHHTKNENSNENITTMLFFHKHSNKNTINNFILIIFGNKNETKYHIFNVIGVLLCINGRLFMIKINNIKCLEKL
jgi:hypothetical protein